MVQPAESRQGLNLAFTLRANFCRPTCWRVLSESEVSPVLMIVEQVRRHQTFEMPLVQDDHVVKQVASATSHPTLSNTVLPRTDTRSQPGRILSSHTEDQGANLFADTLPSSCLADSADPRPIQTKSRSLPVYDGSRSDQDERLPPPGPAHSQRNPEQFVQGSQSTARSL